jgi:hypothetical protein
VRFGNQKANFGRCPGVGLAAPDAGPTPDGIVTHRLRRTCQDQILSRFNVAAPHKIARRTVEECHGGGFAPHKLVAVFAWGKTGGCGRSQPPRVDTFMPSVMTSATVWGTGCRLASKPDPPKARASAKPSGATLRCARRVGGEHEAQLTVTRASQPISPFAPRGFPRFVARTRRSDFWTGVGWSSLPPSTTA